MNTKVRRRLMLAVAAAVTLVAFIILAVRNVTGLTPEAMVAAGIPIATVKSIALVSMKGLPGRIDRKALADTAATVAGDLGLTLTTNLTRYGAPPLRQEDAPLLSYSGKASLALIVSDGTGSSVVLWKDPGDSSTYNKERAEVQRNFGALGLVEAPVN